MRSTILLIAALLAAPSCKKLEPKPAAEAKQSRGASRDRRIRQACASQASYDRLKSLVFEKAEELRAGRSVLLDQLATATVVRMEEPVVKSRDDALNITVCTGRMIIDLPPGTEDAFAGERRLVAPIEYAAQAAADGSGLVYQLSGAEPIIYRLAAIDLKSQPRTPLPTPAIVHTEEPPPTAQARVEPAPSSPPPPPPRPPATPEPQAIASARPSFNCRYARSRTERMICADERLAARDRTMASLYYSAVANTDPGTRQLLRRTRDRFLEQRERCASPACVARTYEDRIDEIDAIMAER